MRGGESAEPRRTTAAAAVSTITPGRPRLHSQLEDAWRYRGLFWFLVWRDIKVRYAQSVIGVGWAVLQPLLMMLVVTILFGHFAGLPSDGAPYWLFSLVALVPWTYVSAGVTAAANSLVANPNLITKVYFPRAIIPFSPVLAGLVDFMTGFTVLILALVAAGGVPGPARLALVPLLLLLMVLVAAGAGSWLAAVNIKYRDVKQAVPFLMQIWMFASPVVYPLSMVPESYRPVYALNPMTGVIEGFRLVLLGTGGLSWTLGLISGAAGAVLFVGGLLYFQRVEATFADVI